MRGDDELNRPGNAIIKPGRKHCGNLTELCNKHFLHLGVKVNFGFFNENKVDTGGAALGLVGFEKLVELKQHEDKISHAQSIVGFGQIDPIEARVMHGRVILQESLHVEVCFSQQSGIIEARIAENAERGQDTLELLVKTTIDFTLDVLNCRFKVLRNNSVTVVSSVRSCGGQQRFKYLTQEIYIFMCGIIQAALGVDESTLNEGTKRGELTGFWLVGSPGSTARTIAA